MVSTLITALIVVATAVIAVKECTALPANKTLLDGLPLGLVTPTPLSCFYEESGTFNQVEVTGCTTEPCSFSPGLSVEIAPTFTPSHTIPTLQFWAYFYPRSGSRVDLAFEFLSGTFLAGNRYRISQEIVISTSIAGKTGYILFYLRDGSRVYISRCFDSVVSN